jgi:hypothetical protein
MSSISSIPAFVPVKAPEPTQPKAPDVKVESSDNASSNEEASAPQPTVLAPLPPGQGTRVNQLV